MCFQSKPVVSEDTVKLRAVEAEEEAALMLLAERLPARERALAERHPKSWTLSL